MSVRASARVCSVKSHEIVLKEAALCILVYNISNDILKRKKNLHQ